MSNYSIMSVIRSFLSIENYGGIADCTGSGNCQKVSCDYIVGAIQNVLLSHEQKQNQVGLCVRTFRKNLTETRNHFWRSSRVVKLS